MTTPSLSGSQLLINTTLPSVQYEPKVAALANGRFVVVWTDTSATGGDTSGYAIRGQILRADGTPEGGEFLVNTQTNGHQWQPDIATLDNGGFVVTWTTASGSTGGDGNGSAIKMQVFDSTGAKVGGETLANQFTSGSQSLSSVTKLAVGGFAVTWQGAGVVGGALEDLGLRLFNSDGTPRGGEITWAPGPGSLDTARTPVLTQLGNGNLLVLYASTAGTPQGEIVGRIFTAAGGVVAPFLSINATTADQQLAPAVAALAGGGFVATWTDNSATSADTSGNAIRAQVFTDAGVRVGAELLVNTTTTNSQIEPVVTALSDGRFLIVWTDQSIGAQSNIRAQLFNANGSTSGSELLVNTLTAGNQINPSATELSDGRVMISWRDAFNGDNIAGQIIDPREAPISISGTAIAEVFVGTRFGDVLNGFGGDDRLFGLAGNDTILGGNGNDTLIGGAGKDLMTGGGGLDRFVFGSLSDSPLAFVGRDVINTFAHGDKIDLSAIDARTNVAGDQAFSFIGAAAFSGVSGQLRFDMTNISVTGVKAYTVYVDVNGDRVADFSLQIFTSPTTDRAGQPQNWNLAAWDFIL